METRQMRSQLPMSTSIDANRRASPTGDDPRLYEQVIELLRDDIASGRLHPGQRLSPERVLSERLGVSRVTLRRALADLIERGFLLASPRRGWFVAPDWHEAQAPPLQSFTDWARLQNLDVTTVVLRSRRRESSRTEERHLDLTRATPIFELERLRLVGSKPFSLERSSVPLELAPFLPEVDFAAASLFAVLRSRAGIVPTRADSTVKIARAPKREARLLEVEDGTSLLRFNELVYDQAGAPFEIHDAWNLGEGYRWTSVLDAATR